MAADTVCHRLFDQEKKRPNAPAYYVRGTSGWESTSWRTYVGQVRQAARALMGLGYAPGQKVCILGFNRPEWVIMDVAAMCAGGAPAGIYTTCSAEEVQYIVSHSEAPVILVENEEQLQKIEAEQANMPDLRYVVIMDGAARTTGGDDSPFRSAGGPTCLSWQEFLSKGDDVEDAALMERVDALEPDGLATLIYTSGTTGPPKAVMLSHQNLAWTARTALDLVGSTHEDSCLSYLPLSHIAEQVFSVHGSLTAGYPVYYAESIDRVPENLKEVQPRIFFGVPRIWEKFHAGISVKLAQATGVKKALVRWALSVGTRVNRERMNRREPSGLLLGQYRLADKLIFSKLKPAIGLGEAKVAVSGAAPISKEILEFFASLDIIVQEVYGQSEDTGPTSLNLANRFRFGTVGPPIPGVEVKIADDGEILVRGPNVFLGYYKDEAATNETLVDGWLCSGDLGEFDRDGFLCITGRKKDIIITAGGKNITPKNIEGSLKNHPLINEAVVIGDRRKFLSALVTIDPEAGERLASEKGLDPHTVHSSAEVQAEVQRAVDDTNSHFARVEQVKKFTILRRNLTIEDGELTPTLKVKRNVVNEHFADEIESMYAE